MEMSLFPSPRHVNRLTGPHAFWSEAAPDHTEAWKPSRASASELLAVDIQPAPPATHEAAPLAEAHIPAVPLEGRVEGDHTMSSLRWRGLQDPQSQEAGAGAERLQLLTPDRGVWSPVRTGRVGRRLEMVDVSQRIRREPRPHQGFRGGRRPTGQPRPTASLQLATALAGAARHRPRVSRPRHPIHPLQNKNQLCDYKRFFEDFANFQ